MPQLWKTWSHSAHLPIIKRESSTVTEQNNSKKLGLGTKYVTTTDDQEPEHEEDDESLPLYMVGGDATLPIKVSLSVDGKLLAIKLDMGAAVTTVSVQ